MTVSTFCDRPTGSPLLICSQEPHTQLFLPLVAWVECLANSPLRPKTGRFPFLPLLVSLFDVSSLVSNSLFVYYHRLDSPPTPPHPHPQSAICPTVVGSNVESAILQSKYLKKFTSSFLFCCLLGRGVFARRDGNMKAHCGHLSFLLSSLCLPTSRSSGGQRHRRRERERESSERRPRSRRQ